MRYPLIIIVFNRYVESEVCAVNEPMKINDITNILDKKYDLKVTSADKMKNIKQIGFVIFIKTKS